MIKMVIFNRLSNFFRLDQAFLDVEFSFGTYFVQTKHRIMDPLSLVYLFMVGKDSNNEAHFIHCFNQSIRKKG